MQFEQSSPVHPVSESRGGSLSVTEKDGRRRKDGEERKFLCLLLYDEITKDELKGTGRAVFRVDLVIPGCQVQGGLHLPAHTVHIGPVVD